MGAKSISPPPGRSDMASTFSSLSIRADLGSLNILSGGNLAAMIEFGEWVLSPHDGGSL
uniref:Uncharacterized protein n=1 Tax=Picea glauca TaxID=3330 RepID=A0A101LXE9_PICGL|nr:hypothetical protein ABT39_MTgene6388 [Picea glauca]QHR86283.1 hypothetical protein Q903MT_gene282 [Picea sitchensis]